MFTVSIFYRRPANIAWSRIQVVGDTIPETAEAAQAVYDSLDADPLNLMESGRPSVSMVAKK